MNYLFRHYYTVPLGCPVVPKTNAYRQAGTEGYQANDAKAQFVQVYNPLARQFGLKSDWKPTEI